SEVLPVFPKPSPKILCLTFAISSSLRAPLAPRRTGYHGDLASPTWCPDFRVHCSIHESSPPRSHCPDASEGPTLIPSSCLQPSRLAVPQIQRERRHKP